MWAASRALGWQAIALEKGTQYFGGVCRRLWLDEIIPQIYYQRDARWFRTVAFADTAVGGTSTLSSQFHTVGTSIGRDVYEQVTSKQLAAAPITRIGIIIGTCMRVVTSFMPVKAPLLPVPAVFLGCVHRRFCLRLSAGCTWKRMTRAGAISSIFVGFIVTAFC